MKTPCSFAVWTGLLALFSHSGQCEETPKIPTLSISKAASIAEAELERLQASKSHYIKVINFMNGINPRYSVMIEPPLPADPSDPEGKKTGISIYMDGKVVSYPVTITRRIIKPKPEKAEQGAAANP